MAIIGFIVLGDRTSHGGTVISGDTTYTIDRQPIARLGDKVFCPRCKQTTIITSSRFPTVSSFGQAMAYDQDTTSCGALLYSRHNGHAGGDTEGSEGDAASAAAPAAASVSIEEHSPKAPLRFQEHFILHDEAGKLVANIPYAVKTGDGHIYEGETDAEGRTAVVWTDAPEALEVTVQPKKTDVEDPYHYDEQSYGDL